MSDIGSGPVGLGSAPGAVSTVGGSGSGQLAQTFQGQFYWPTLSQLEAAGFDASSKDANTQLIVKSYAGQPMATNPTSSKEWAATILSIKDKLPALWNAIQAITKAPSLQTSGKGGWSTYMNNVYEVTKTDLNGQMGSVDPSVIPGSGVAPKTPVQNLYGEGLSSATASQGASAFDTLQNELTSWNLEADIPAIKQLIFKQGDQLINTGTLTDIVRGVTKTGDPKLDKMFKANYDNAFPGLSDHNSALGVGSEKMTEAQYQQYVQTVQGVAQQYGLPKGFINKQEIATLVKGQVSATEFSDRIAHLYTAANNADPATKQMLQQYYGLTTGDLAAHFADPTKAYPLLERQLTSSTLGGYAQEVGLNGLTQSQAEELANRVNQGGMSSTGATLGSQSISTIENSLLTASRDARLTTSQPGVNAPALDTASIVGSQVAGFAGTNQRAAQVQVGRAEQAAAAPFEKGGGYAENAKGVVGLGSART